MNTALWNTLPYAHPQSDWAGWRWISTNDSEKLQEIFAGITWCDRDTISGAAPFAEGSIALSNQGTHWLNTVGTLDDELAKALGLKGDPSDYEGPQIALSGIGKTDEGAYLLVTTVYGFGGGSHYFLLVNADHPAIGILTRRWAKRAAELQELIRQMQALGMLDEGIPYTKPEPFPAKRRW